MKIRQIIEKFLKKIKQAHCEHDWQRGIAEYNIQNGWRASCRVPFYEGQLVSFDDLGGFTGMIKRCRKCEKSETDEDVKVLGQVVKI